MVVKNKKETKGIVPSKTSEVTATVAVEESIKNKHTSISNMDTPKFYIKEKQGFEYVDEGYMRHVLNQHYPLWTWEIIKYELLGSEWVAVHGRLTINDNGVARNYDSLSSHRIQKKRDSGEFVDISNDMKAANSDAFKVAVNRLCNVSDDVYRKRIQNPELSDKQKKLVTDLAKKADMLDRVESAITKGSINKFNVSRTIEQLKSQIEKGA
tara:strand:- start:149 stop:781 length:633 start_codon:yes stop_codon:yes gene_type:complete